jgi:hypothetical protein
MTFLFRRSSKSSNVQLFCSNSVGHKTIQNIRDNSEIDGKVIALMTKAVVIE